MQPWIKVRHEDKPLLFGGELPPGGMVNGPLWGGTVWGYSDVYALDCDMWVVVHFGTGRHWIAIWDGMSKPIFAPLDWDEVQSIPQCPPNWDIPF